MKVLGSEVGSGWFRIGSEMAHGEISWSFEGKCLVPRLVQVGSELVPKWHTAKSIGLFNESAWFRGWFRLVPSWFRNGAWRNHLEF